MVQKPVSEYLSTIPDALTKRLVTEDAANIERKCREMPDGVAEIALRLYVELRRDDECLISEVDPDGSVAVDGWINVVQLAQAIVRAQKDA